MPLLCSSRLRSCWCTPLQSWKKAGHCLGGRAGRGHIGPLTLQRECEGVMGGRGGGDTLPLGGMRRILEKKRSGVSLDALSHVQEENATPTCAINRNIAH